MKRWPAYALYDFALSFSGLSLLSLPFALIDPYGAPLWRIALFLFAVSAILWLAAILGGRRHGLRAGEYVRNIRKPAFESRDDYKPQP